MYHTLRLCTHVICAHILLHVHLCTVILIFKCSVKSSLSMKPVMNTTDKNHLHLTAYYPLTLKNDENKYELLQ